MTHTAITIRPYPDTITNWFKDTIYLEAVQIPLGTCSSFNQHRRYLRYILAFL